MYYLKKIFFLSYNYNVYVNDGKINNVYLYIKILNVQIKNPV